MKRSETVEETWRRTALTPHEATIERDMRWGPFAWVIHYRHGPTSLECPGSAWTREGAERKARRRCARWDAKAARRVASRQVVSA